MRTCFAIPSLPPPPSLFYTHTHTRTQSLHTSPLNDHVADWHVHTRPSEHVHCSRYYAVGFASRQLCPSAAVSSVPATSSGISSCLGKPKQQLLFMEQVASKMADAVKVARVSLLHELGADLSLECMQQAISAGEELSLHLKDAAIACRQAWQMLYSSSSAKSIMRRMPQESARFFEEATAKGGTSIRAVLWHLCCGDAAADVSRIARLAPAPAALWDHPAAWCVQHTVYMGEQACSECGKDPGQGAEQLLNLQAWQVGWARRSLAHN